MISVIEDAKSLPRKPIPLALLSQISKLSPLSIDKKEQINEIIKQAGYSSISDFVISETLIESIKDSEYTKQCIINKKVFIRILKGGQNHEKSPDYYHRP